MSELPPKKPKPILAAISDEENITNKIQAKKEELKQTDLTPWQRRRLNQEIVVLRKDEKRINDPLTKLKDKVWK